MVLRHHAGAAQHHPAGRQQVFQVAQALAEQQFVDIADEAVAGQVGAAADRRMARQGPRWGRFDRDGQIGLALGQADEARHRQDVQRDVRIAPLEVGRQRRQHVAAEALGGADAQVAGQGLADPGQRLAGAVHRALHLLRVHEQALAVLGQDEAGAARFLEQQGVQLAFQRADAARHGGVLDPELARRGADPLGPRDLQEIPQTVPIQHVFRS
ncbi:hypothetical protein BBAD15_g12484 [Beauveria bassiana D1-5]|uniref:Uncharacterized protein n=1 Tax=Beauveria bassiana D1-5 TaxID=1245745 RepID=A0A0A2V3F4_BEABA|nr:hypothetical protein BBAD15_g12484 [Beauveria bassiana D1-5]